MSSRVVDIFFLLAFSFLTLVGGIYLWRHFVEKPTTTTKMVVVEKPVIFPPKVITLQGKPVLVPDSSRSAREDSLIAEIAKRGSLDSLARWRGQKFATDFSDTLQVSDSIGSFRVREVHHVEVDGTTQMIQKTVKYLDGYLKVFQKETTVNTKSFDFLVAGLVFIGGVVIGLLTGIFK